MNKEKQNGIIVELSSRRDEFHQDALELIKELKVELALLRWIPVSERLPKMKQKVDLCVKVTEDCEDGGQWITRKKKCNVLWSHLYVFGCNVEITHWMPTPQLPEKGGV